MGSPVSDAEVELYRVLASLALNGGRFLIFCCVAPTTLKIPTPDICTFQGPFWNRLTLSV